LANTTETGSPQHSQSVLPQKVSTSLPLGAPDWTKLVALQSPGMQTKTI